MGDVRNPIKIWSRDGQAKNQIFITNEFVGAVGRPNSSQVSLGAKTGPMHDATKPYPRHGATVQKRPVSQLTTYANAS